MRDLRTQLDRVADRARIADDPFERLTRRRRVRRRNRRITAAALALAVAAAGTGAVLFAFRGAKNPAPATQNHRPSRYLSLWPDPIALDTLQSHVDAGKDRWMLSARETAIHFAGTVLGWTKPYRVVLGHPSDTGPLNMTLSGCSGAQCERLSVSLTLERVLSPGRTGIWSVVRVSNDNLAILLQPGQDFRAGSTVQAKARYSRLHHPIVAGYVAFEGCTEDSGERYLSFFGGITAFTIGPKEVRSRAPSGGGAANCSVSVGGGLRPPPLKRPAFGYVYVFTSSPPDKHDGEVLFSPDRFGITYQQVEDLAAVPVRFVPATRPKNEGPYPRGAFEACPDTAGTIHTDGFGAGHFALKFSRLWATGQHAKARRYVDPSAKKLENWAAAGSPKRFRVLRSRPARRDRLVRYGSGKRVAERSWEVVIDDGTTSSSLDFTIYLIHRSNGWKVWGAY